MKHVTENVKIVAVSKQNLTLSLDKEVIRRAKILAAKRSVSISQLVAEELTRLVEDAEAYEQARRLAVTELSKGFHSGGYEPVSRDELHER